VRAVIGFGGNMLLAHANGGGGREALKQLEFYPHADLFIEPDRGNGRHRAARRLGF
jgi:hypothetical protein